MHTTNNHNQKRKTTIRRQNIVRHAYRLKPHRETQKRGTKKKRKHRKRFFTRLKYIFHLFGEQIVAFKSLAPDIRASKKPNTNAKHTHTDSQTHSCPHLVKP